MHFVTPVVLAFTSGAQLTLVAGQLPDAGQQVQGMAGQLVGLSQRTELPCGAAIRTKDVEACLVSVPVTEPEQASGRTGLAVVLGAISSARTRAGHGMYQEILASTLVPALLAGPNGGDRGVRGWAEALTQELQTHDGGPVTEHCRSTAAEVAQLYSQLVNGYGRERSAQWHPTEPRQHLDLLVAAQTELLYATGRDHLAYLVPLFDTARVPDFTGRLARHNRVDEEHLLLCVNGTLR
jgi:hypothetical protein